MAQSFNQDPVKMARRETAPARTRRLRSVLFQVYLAAAVLAFAGLFFLARTTAYFSIDLAITRLLQGFAGPLFLALMQAVSWPGYMPQAVILALGFVLLVSLFGYHWEAVMLTATVVLVQAANVAVKFYVQRPRPPQDLVEVYQVLTSYSFPSGHVMFYTALYGFLLFLVLAVLRHSWLRTLLAVLFGGLVGLVGISRITLGEHWASDVLAAYLLGSLGLAGGVAVYRWGKNRFFVTQPSAAPEGDGEA